MQVLIFVYNQYYTIPMQKKKIYTIRYVGFDNYVLNYINKIMHGQENMYPSLQRLFMTRTRNTTTTCHFTLI